MCTEGERDRLEPLLSRIVRGAGPSWAEHAELDADGATTATSQALAAAGWPAIGPLEARIEMLRRAAAFCPAYVVDAAGHRVDAAVRLGELWRFYLPFCRALIARPVDTPSVRTLVGIGGPPGSGKSALAALLAALIDAVTGRACSIVVPLDGFHFPNAYLDSHFVGDPDGTQAPLRRMKGAPETFDACAFADALGLLAHESSLRLPRYDRLLHDPVPGGVRVEAHHRIAFVEGNYVLLDREGWRDAAALLDLRLFIDMPLEAVRAGIIERHMRGGRSREDAERHFKAVDVPNHRLCMAQASRADLILTRGPDHGILSVMLGRETHTPP